jgi:hypothetical protein
VIPIENQSGIVKAMVSRKCWVSFIFFCEDTPGDKFHSWSLSCIEEQSIERLLWLAEESRVCGVQVFPFIIFVYLWHCQFGESASFFLELFLKTSLRIGLLGCPNMPLKHSNHLFDKLYFLVGGCLFDHGEYDDDCDDDGIVILSAIRDREIFEFHIMRLSASDSITSDVSLDKIRCGDCNSLTEV